MVALQNYFKYSLSQWKCETNVGENDLKVPLMKKVRVLNQNLQNAWTHFFMWYE